MKEYKTDTKAVRWAEKNEWFGINNKEELKKAQEKKINNT